MHMNDAYFTPDQVIEYMFDTLGFLWIHHNSPLHMIYLLDKLAAWFSGKIQSKSVQLPLMCSVTVNYHGEASGAGCCSRKSEVYTRLLH